jgi:hypothetical protein
MYKSGYFIQIIFVVRVERIEYFNGDSFSVYLAQIIYPEFISFIKKST